MKNNLIVDAVAKLVSTSEDLEKFCNDPQNYNSYEAHLLEQLSWEIHKQATSLKEVQYLYGL